MIGRFRADGTVLFANQAYARACGFSCKDMRGANLREILPPDQFQHIQTQLLALSPTASELRQEKCVRTREGDRWTLWKFYAIDFDDRGACREVEVIGIDITEAKRAEKELLAINARLRIAERDLNRAQALAGIGSWRLDGTSGLYEWSAETYRIFAVPRSTRATYDLFIAAVHPEDRARVEATWLSALENKTDYDIQHRIFADGALKWVHERAALSWDSDGLLLEVLGTCQDITASKVAEEDLRRSETRFRALVSASSELVVRADRRGRMIGEVYGWQAFSGQAPEQFSSGGWTRMVHDDDRRMALCAWMEALRTGEPFDIECRMLRHDGIWRWVRWTCVPVHGEFGEVVELVGMFSDITERKEWELALESRVRERTAAVSAARDEATRANAEKSKFLSAASHDLRQPLHAASLYLSALQRRVMNPEQIELCGKIEQALESTSDMLRALLDISRFESGAVVREPRAFLVQDLIDRVIANSSALVEAKGLRIVNAPTNLAAYSDPGLLERIIDNFFTNAVRYTEAGGTITVSCERCDNGLRIAVQDTGVGIPATAFEKIFDEFVQVDNPARTGGKGLGLGLAIAKHIANLLGCRIHVVSEIGQGSTFSIETQAAIAAPRRVARRSRMIGEPAAPGRSLLLIEDDPMVADAVTLVLFDAGFTVTHVVDGDDALASLAAGLRPILIVSDYWLPRDNGVELIARLRAMLGTIVPALLVTGDTALQTNAVGLEQCHVVHKPLDAPQLMGMLRQLAA